MITRTHVELAAAAVLILLGVLGFRSWLAEHDLRKDAEAKVEAQKSVVEQAQTSIDKLETADRDRDAQAAAAIAAIQASSAKQITPAEIAAWLPKQAQGVPQPITVQIPAATPQNPAPAAIATIPEADLAPLRDQITKCQACGVSLAAAQGDAASKAEQLKLAGEQLSAMEKERDDWKTAAKGGTIWQRMKRATQWIVVGVGVGAAAVCGTGHCK